jgi:hypothetical protein
MRPLTVGVLAVLLAVALASDQPYFIRGNSAVQQTYSFGYDTTSGHKDDGQPRLMREEQRLEDGTVIGRYG